MNTTSVLDKKTTKLLRANNFMQKGNIFLRIHGDGILQCIFAVREPSILFKNLPSLIRSSICVSVHSLYEPDVFGDITKYKGALRYPYNLDDFNSENFLCGSTCELLERACLPKLNQLSTQKDLCCLVNKLELSCFQSGRWYMDMLTIPSLMVSGEYTHALEICNKALACNRSIGHVSQMKNLILSGDQNAIRTYLEEAKNANIETYEKLHFH